MKQTFLLFLLMCSFANNSLAREIDIKLISPTVLEIHLAPGTAFSETELEDGILDTSDTKANYSVIFFKEDDHFVGVSRKKIKENSFSKISFKIRSKDKIENVQQIINDRSEHRREF